MNISFSERLFGLIAQAETVSTSGNRVFSFWERISPPEDISTSGHLIEWLFNYTTYVNLFWFALVCIGLFGFSYLYSQKRHKIALYTHGNEKKHLLITALIGLGVFLSVDMVITKISTRDMKEVFWNFLMGMMSLRFKFSLSNGHGIFVMLAKMVNSILVTTSFN